MSRLRSGFRTAEESPGFLLWKAANNLQRLHAEALGSLAITPTQMSFLTCLVYLSASGPVTSARIAAHAGMDKMTVSDLVRALLSRDLIAKAPNPEDRRSFLIRPTRRGTLVTNRAVRRIEALDERFFATVAERAALLRGLAVLAAGGR